MIKFIKGKSFIRFKDISWPRCDGEYIADINWKLRYSPKSLTKEEMLSAASVLSAYAYLPFMTQKRRNEVCSVLKAAERTIPKIIKDDGILTEEEV